MATSSATSSQTPESQGPICIGLGILICLAAFFLVKGSQTGDFGGASYAYSYAAGGGGGGHSSMLSLPRLLMLSLGATLIVIGAMSKRDS